jgi:hypothetical protein
VGVDRRERRGQQQQRQSSGRKQALLRGWFGRDERNLPVQREFIGDRTIRELELHLERIPVDIE